MKYKELSSAATGIVLKKTKISTDKRRGVIKSILIEPMMDSFTVEYFVERLDSKGNVFSDVSYNTKKVRFKDVPEIGTVEYRLDEPTLEIPGSYVKVTDENLVVSNWYKTVGDTLLIPAIAYIETKDGL